MELDLGSLTRCAVVVQFPVISQASVRREVEGFCTTVADLQLSESPTDSEVCCKSMLFGGSDDSGNCH